MARSAAFGLVAALIVVACGSASVSPAPGSSTAGSPSATAQGASGSPSPLVIDGVTVQAPEYSDATLQQIGGEERRLVTQDRQEAGVAEAIGPDGAAVLTSVDTAEAAAGAVFFQGIRDRFADAGSGFLASTRSLPGIAPLDPQVAAGLTGLAAFSAAAFAIQAGASAIAHADEAVSGEVPSEPQTMNSTDGGQHTSQVLRQTMTLSSGAGKVVIEVTIEDTATVTDASTGAAKGTLTESAMGHFEINACPDPQGVVSGMASLKLHTDWTDAGATAAGSTGSTDLEAPFRLLVNDDARVYHMEMDSSSTISAQGVATTNGQPAPYQWDASSSMSFGFDSGPGGAVSGTSGGTSGHGASDAQLKEAVGAAIFLPGLILASAKEPTEAFFRGGKCVEVIVQQGEGGEVEKNASVQITAQPRQKWEGTDLAKPVVATLDGVASLDPAGKPVDAPASFTYIAGPELKDKGTVTLKSTSNRGIGTTMETYTVGGYDTLNVTVSGTLDYTAALFARKLTVNGTAVVHLQDDGRLHGTSTFHVTFFNQYTGGCPVNFSGSVPVTVTVDPFVLEDGRITVRVLGPTPVYHPLGQPDCMFGSDLGTEFGAWAVGITGKAAVGGGPSTEKTSTTGQIAETYTFTATITQP